MAKLFHNIGELTTNDPSLGDASFVGRLHDAAFVVEDHQIIWVGESAMAPACDEAMDCDGAAVIPGFVDSHTHLVFAGERSDEFEARMAGERYDGGGIMRTVRATREASDEHLRRETERRIHALRMGGVTTFEAKSGYALTLEGEARLCALSAEITPEATFLGAHVVPAEYADRRDDYVSLVSGDMLERCAPLVRWADVFCDRGAFSVDEARHILQAAKAKGLALRLHGNQLGATGGVGLAVELDAASVDHCTYLDERDIHALAGSRTVATLLPGAEFSTKSPYPDARRLWDAGVSIALATDCNPGTSYVTSMGFVIALAVQAMGLRVEEALWAATKGGANALRRTDIGHLGLGARADFVMLDAPRAAHLAYRPGSDIVKFTHLA